MKTNLKKIRSIQALCIASVAAALSSLSSAQSSMKTDSGGPRLQQGQKDICTIFGPKATGTPPPISSRESELNSVPRAKLGYTTTWTVLGGKPIKVSYCVIPTFKALGGEAWTTPLTLSLVDKREKESAQENPAYPGSLNPLANMVVVDHVKMAPKSAVVPVPVAAGTTVTVAAPQGWCEEEIAWVKRPALFIETSDGTSCPVQFGAPEKRQSDPRSALGAKPVPLSGARQK